MHIAIAGNIGAGKTTLTRLLSKHYGWDTHFEDVEQNPYLNDFYEDMQRWSFNLQVYYLNSRFTQIQDIKSATNSVIQDRTIYEDAYIFAPNLHSMGLMTTRDFENYFSLFNLLESFIAAPDVLIYLKASVPKLVNQIQKRGRGYEESIRLDYLKASVPKLVNQIQKRGRGYEESIRLDYLKRLNERYESWISTYDKGKLIIIDVDNNNFVEDADDLGKIINAIDAEINGLF